MARVAVSNRPNVVKYYNFTGASPRVEVRSDSSLLVTSDLDLQVLFYRTSTTQFGTLLSRLNFLGTQYGFYFSIDNNTNNRLNYRWSPTGASGGLVSKVTAVFVPVPLGTPIWLRVTHDVDNGAAGNDVRFYWGVYNGTITPPTTWTQLGSTINTAGTTTVFNPTAQGIAAGSFGSGSTGALPAGARIYRAIVKDGIDGTTIVDINPSNSSTIFGGAISFEMANNRIIDITGGVAFTKSRATASGRVSAP